MSLQELDVIRGILRETDLGLAGPPEQARPTFKAMCAGLPVAEGAALEERTLGDVPVVVADTGVGDEAPTLRYVHGGACAVGSAWGYRSLWSALAVAANARGIALDYRRAPEDPFPAAVDDAVAAYRAKPRVFMPYMGGVGPYAEHCATVADNGYDDFELGD